MRVWGVDPGSVKSGWVLFDGRQVLDHGIEFNPVLLARLESLAYSDDLTVVFERVSNYGHAIGDTIFQTVFWTGRFVQQVESHRGRWDHLTRVQVKTALCRSVRATDAHIRHALIQRFGPRMDMALGTREAPGPLHGIVDHEWAALGVAVVWHDLQRHPEARYLPPRKKSAAPPEIPAY